MAFKISRVQRLSAVIGISLCFFIAEISIGFYTHSLALVADAFHYLNDLVGFAIALAATIVAEKSTPPKALTFGWQRIQLLGAFFNGVLLFGLGISVFLQSIERFITLQRVEEPKLVLIMGCVGFGLNIISVLFLHDHDHDHGHGHGHGNGHGHGHDHSHENSDSAENGASVSLVDEKQLTFFQHVHHKHYTNTKKSLSGKQRDLAMMGVLIHVLGDCANNIGVVIAAAVIWFASYGERFYADPAVSMGIAMMIFISSIPLIKQSGLILLQSAPQGVDYDDVKHDLERIPGILAIHELHIWRLNQEKSLASAHIVLDGEMMTDFESLAKTIRECFHEYGIHSITLQPEAYTRQEEPRPVTAGRCTGADSKKDGEDGKRRTSIESALNRCTSGCGSFCVELTCCR
ncbi:cation efflux protein [Penicillium verhagenii]|uniref:cation efflux protein n=1 Tax=Penicillium verhagenii TaxID=1562060 RepID=UPI0025457F5B|nr:cation efflux protein [Penicillium verhagenii]KAJ5934426.1 cation efflux protein [Penicillium verhagenii]